MFLDWQAIALRMEPTVNSCQASFQVVKFHLGYGRAWQSQLSNNFLAGAGQSWIGACPVS